MCACIGFKFDAQLCIGEMNGSKQLVSMYVVLSMPQIVLSPFSWSAAVKHPVLY